MDANYLSLKLASKKAAATPARQAIAIDRPASVYIPKTNHPHKVAQEKQKESEGKKAREDKDKVLEMLFSAFEKHQYYNIKDLQKLTKQPIVSYLSPSDCLHLISHNLSKCCLPNVIAHSLFF